VGEDYSGHLYLCTRSIGLLLIL